MDPTELAIACVAALSPSSMDGIPDGFRSAESAPSVPWKDFWFVGLEEQTCRMVREARPWVCDNLGNCQELEVMHTRVTCLDRGLALGWVQVFDRPDYDPYEDAFVTLMTKLF